MKKRSLAYLVTFVTEDLLLPDGRPSYPPMAAMYLATALRRAGFDPRVLHLLPEHLGRLISLIEAERPAFIGFSTLTGAVLAPALDASRHAKELGIPVVWGGVHASTVPELCLKEAADYVVLGEGEETIMELADFLDDGGDRPVVPTDKIAGVMSVSEDGFQCGPSRKPLENLDSFPPAWDMVDPAQYVNYTYPGGAMPFLISRGCPYRCRFCYNEVMRAGKWRRHSDEYIAETLDDLLKRAAFSIVEFGDDFVFETPGKSSSWIEVLARRGLKWNASFRAGALTEEFVRWIEEHGCTEVRIGMESGYPATLEALGKKLVVDDLYKATHALARTSIRARVGFVMNWPKEPRESVISTLKITDDLARINPRMRFNLGYYIPMPGPPIYRDALDEGFIEPSSNEEWSRIFDHPYRFRGFRRQEIDAIELISGRLYRHYFKPWPLQRLVEPGMRWRWRHGYFQWFAVGALRKWIKSIGNYRATPVEPEVPISEP